MNLKYNIAASKFQNFTFLASIVLFIVQRPAPAKNIQIIVDKYSAKVMYEIETSSSASSYITKVNVHLNGQKYRIITRRQDMYSINITGLLPNTDYEVGIETEDGSFQKSSRVSSWIKTKAGIYIFNILTS